MSAATAAALERYHPRVAASIAVKVLVNGRAFLAHAKDVSMNGIYLLAQPPANQERFTISIPLPGDREVVTKCRVRRRHADGVGVEFEQLDWEDLFALARFLHPRLP